LENKGNFGQKDSQFPIIITMKKEVYLKCSAAQSERDKLECKRKCAKVKKERL